MTQSLAFDHPDAPDAEIAATIARIRLSGVPDDRAMLRAAAELTRDLHTPNKAMYWTDCFLSAAIGYRVIFGGRQAPVFDTKFHLPTARTIDAKLVGGSALFGVGWGISGFCPGGAIPALGFAPWPTALFLISMGGGILLARWLQTLPRRQTA